MRNTNFFALDSLTQRHLKRTKSDYSTPIIASMHGASTGAWLDFAVEIQDCGADALELNWQSGRCDPNESGEQVEARMLEWVSQIRSRVTLVTLYRTSLKLCILLLEVFRANCRNQLVGSL